jgi:sugar/nucleoside kinase (ribokinase family)
MLKTLSFGAVILDIIENEPFLGGDSLNVTANLHKLGAEAYLLTRLGNDDYGTIARKKNDRAGCENKIYTGRYRSFYGTFYSNFQ